LYDISVMKHVYCRLIYKKTTYCVFRHFEEKKYFEVLSPPL